MHRGKLHCNFFPSETFAGLVLLKEVRLFPDRMIIKLLTFDNYLFPLLRYLRTTCSGMTTTLCCHLYNISLVVGMLLLSLPTLGCFVVSDDICLIGKLFLSLPTWGCFDISNEFDLVGMLLLLLSPARNVSTSPMILA